MIDKDFSVLYCEECGSTDVEMKMWVNPNTEEIAGDCSSPKEEEDCWCKMCEEHVKLLTLPELWERFSHVSVNADDEIEDCFLDFPVGTPKFDVWHWFDERCPNNLHDDLMYSKSK